ncbi:hypothetical protein [Streptomyces sp. 142MFCol3.1]|uniref:hypothetical protein n=1 Tax=Streptomyces sp. 142MFCol3.1 TaxID=1172179 RepID=UPI000685757B|nr:hypothetical protein [Streptomyces sp. 142MFCol3.1]
MIGVRVRTRTSGAGRLWLLLGVVLIVVAHLAGAVHGAALAGTHTAFPVISHADGAEYTADGIKPSPGHDHTADGHVDHVADRPRTGEIGPGPGHDGPDTPPATAVAPGAAHAPGGGPPRPLAAADRRGIRALHCVWRL